MYKRRRVRTRHLRRISLLSVRARSWSFFSTLRLNSSSGWAKFANCTQQDGSWQGAVATLESVSSLTLLTVSGVLLIMGLWRLWAVVAAKKRAQQPVLDGQTRILVGYVVATTMWTSEHCLSLRTARNFSTLQSATSIRTTDAGCSTGALHSGLEFMRAFSTSSCSATAFASSCVSAVPACFVRRPAFCFAAAVQAKVHAPTRTILRYFDIATGCMMAMFLLPILCFTFVKQSAGLLTFVVLVRACRCCS